MTKCFFSSNTFLKSYPIVPTISQFTHRANHKSIYLFLLLCYTASPPNPASLPSSFIRHPIPPWELDYNDQPPQEVDQENDRPASTKAYSCGRCSAGCNSLNQSIWWIWPAMHSLPGKLNYRDMLLCLANFTRVRKSSIPMRKGLI